MSPAPCRRCGTALDAEATLDLGDGSRLSYGFGEKITGRRCPRCRWANRDGGKEESRLAAIADTVPGIDLSFPDTRDPADLDLVLRRARAALTGSLRSLVAESPDVAMAWLLQGVAEVEAELTVLEDKLVLGLQQVYACLVADGPLPVFQDPVPVPTSWFERVTPLIAGNAVLSGLIRELPLGTFENEQLQDGVFSADLGPRARWAFEVNLNVAAVPPEDPLEASWRVAELKRATIGVSVTDLFALVYEPGELDRLTRVRREGGLIIVDLGTDHPLIHALNNTCVLARRWWTTRSAPSFFFLDDRPASRTAQALVTAAAELDWLRYAPLLQAQYVNERGPHAAAVTSRGLLDRAFARALGSVAGRAQRVETAARQGPGEMARRASALTRSVHAEFEEGAAQACRAGGLLAVNGLERLGGKPMPCGEIDVLAVGEGPEGPVAVVVECKNVDTTFFKDFGPDQAETTLDKAATQARRKAAWVEQNWPLVARELNWSARPPAVVRLVVSRRAAFPTLEGGIPVVALRELSDFVEDLVTLPPRQWWPALTGEPIRDRWPVGGGPSAM